MSLGYFLLAIGLVLYTELATVIHCEIKIYQVSWSASQLQK